jgi:predicted nuclease of predicted toxin-antitoxin system
MRLLIDMNLSPKWEGFLRQSGFDAAHWSQVGSPRAGDPEIMAHARANGFVVLTNDLDFGSILAATGGDAPSVVQIRAEDCRVEAIGKTVVDAIKLASDQLAKGALVTVDVARLRVTMLPIETSI